MQLRLRQRLSCSFCGKSEKEVNQLLAGKKGHICDACIGVCSDILQAVPRKFKGWEAMETNDLLAALQPSAASVEGTKAVLYQQVDVLRKRGLSWGSIGTALNISRQAAWERFS